MMSTRMDDRGLTLIEVMIASLILMVGLAGLLTTFPAAYTNVVASGGETKAVTYAQETMEDLKNQPFDAAFWATIPFDNSGTPEAPEQGYTRSWTITQEAGTAAPNRLVRIAVTVTWTEGPQQRPPQTVTLETLRLEE